MGQAPDFEAFQETVAKVQEQIDKLQKEQQAFTAKINERSVGKEDFFAKKALIRGELDEVSKEMDMYAEKRDKIRAALGEKKAENADMKAELGKMKKSMTFTSEADIDARLATIEKIMSQTSISLKDEKAYMVEIKELKKNKPKLAQLGNIQDKLTGFDAGKDLAAQKNELNEQMAILREKKKGISERLTEVTEARKAQLGDFGEVAEQRDKISTQIKELIAQRTQLRDDFGNAKREFQSYLADQRRIKQEKYAEERKVQQEQWRLQKLEKQVEALDEQPFVSEITLIEQTVKFCKSLLPQDTEAKKDEAKETVFNNKDGEEVLMKKEDRNNEFYYAPTKKGKSAKKTKGSGEDASKKPIKHNAEPFKLFDSLKLDAPITTADIPAILVKLAEQKAMYEGKVKEWEENKEEMKRKIKEGIVTAEDLEEKKETKEDAK